MKYETQREVQTFDYYNKEVIDLTHYITCGDYLTWGDLVDYVTIDLIFKNWPLFIWRQVSFNKACLNHQNEWKTMSQEPECARFRRVLSCTPIV